MSQGTTTHQPYDDAAYPRRVGVLVVAAAAVAAVMVATHGKNHGRAWNPGFTGALSLFGWAHWILVALLVAAGVILARATSPTLTATAAAVGLAPAAQLVGAGIVAGRRWHPVAGMSGPGIWANQGMLEIIAGAGALAAAVALLAFVRVLGVARRAQPEPLGVSAAGRSCVVIGVLVAVALPPLLAIGDPFAHDITSLGAVALVWSLPWGGVLALTAFLGRPAAIAAALTVTVSAASAYPNYALVRVEHHWVAVLVGLVSGLLVAGLRVAPGRHAPALRGEQLPQ